MNPDNIHLQQAVSHFNAQVSPQDSLTVEAVLKTPPKQKALSLKLDTHMFQALVSSASPANKARIHVLSVSAPHASFWVSAIPFTGLNMHLDTEECQVAIRWWLDSTHQPLLLAPSALELYLTLLVTMQAHAGMVEMWSPVTTTLGTPLPNSATKLTCL